MTIEDLMEIRELNFHSVVGAEGISKNPWKKLKKLFINKANMDENGINELLQGKDLFKNLEIFVFKSSKSKMTAEHMK